jgi:hypothetical protein
MLQWFVTEKTALDGLDGMLIGEELVETLPNNVSSSILDDSAASVLPHLRQYSTTDGWVAVEAVLKAKKEQEFWPCPVCELCTTSGATLGCDGCLLWLHKACIGKKAGYTPRTRFWFCGTCTRAAVSASD